MIYKPQVLNKPMKIATSILRCLIFIILSGFLSSVYAQDNNKLTKANTLFKAKRFAEAIPLYEEILIRDFNKTVLLKLARSHRQLNNLSEALDHFSTLMAQPEVKSEHQICLLYTSPSPRDQRGSRMPSSA